MLDKYLEVGQTLIVTEEFQTEQKETAKLLTKVFPLNERISIWAITDHWVYVKYNGVIVSTPYDIAYRMRKVYLAQR